MLECIWFARKEENIESLHLVAVIEVQSTTQASCHG